ncbi:hypothetical protein B0H14DRAFT_3127235 [Mycena olivaceomarginata]|nr:hypothetical protein B0H14DRAFT_3127235 [Mycena olivaceomarginata]
MLNDHPRALSRLIALLITGVCLTFLVLCAYAYTIWNPVSRPCVNRVSLRLLALALIFNLGFGVSFLFATLLSKQTMPCAFIAFFANFSQMFSAGMFFCMALNLHLVLVHKVSGQKMEKFYYLGTSIFAAACSVTPLAVGVYGWSSHSQSCWFTTHTRAETFRWSIGTQSFWMPFMAVGEAFVFLSIIAFFISYEMATRRYRSDSNTLDLADRYRPGSPFVKHRYTIIRIGLYPLVSCITNFSTSLIDIYQLTHVMNWRLAVVALAIYNSRLTICSLLAFADPSFIRAVKEIWRHMSPPTIFSAPGTRVPTLTQISFEYMSNAALSSAQMPANPEAAHENQEKVQNRSDDITTQI